MELLTFADVQSAAKQLHGHAVRTPLIESSLLNEITGGRILLKAECLQRTGSFKFRGAYNALSRLDKSSGNNVFATSSGNHAQGVAEAARLLGFNATIVMPADAPETKKTRTIRSGAKIVEYDRYNDDREQVVAELAKASGAPIIHPFENFHVMAGQGTAGLEAAQDLLNEGLSFDRAFVCAGGGGLASGTLVSLRHHFPSVKLHPVEPEHYDDFGQSLQAGKIIRADTTNTSVCDAIITPQPGARAFKLAKKEFSQGLVVTDAEALSAVAFAFNELKLVVEPGGAAALAAALFGKHNVKDETVLVTLSGGNIDTAMLQRALDENP